MNSKFKKLVPTRPMDEFTTVKYPEIDLVEEHNDKWEARNTDTSEFERRGKIFKKKKKVKNEQSEPTNGKP